MTNTDNLALDKEFKSITAMSDHIDTLHNVYEQIAKNGCDKTSFIILSKAKMLSSSASEVMASESFSNDNEDLQSTALEDLKTSISEKMREWTTRILNFVKNVGTKVKEFLESVWNKVSESFSKARSFSSEKIATAKKSFESVDMKTLVKVAAGIAAVAGIAAIVLSFMPGDYANESKLKSLIYRVSDAMKKVRVPFTKNPIVTVTENGLKMGVTIESTPMTEYATSGFAAAKGFVISNINILYNTLKRSFLTIFNFAVKIPDTIFSFIGSHLNAVDAAKQFGKDSTPNVDIGRGRAWFLGKVTAGLMIAFYRSIFEFITKIAIRGYNVVKSALNSFNKSVDHEETQTT